MAVGTPVLITPSAMVSVNYATSPYVFVNARNLIANVNSFAPSAMAGVAMNGAGGQPGLGGQAASATISAPKGVWTTS